MKISQQDIKLLWGRSGNRCAICRIELSQDSKNATASYPLGEQAHIVGEKPDAPRGQSILREDERNGYHNIVLLCPNDHTKIDKNPGDWPVEKLHMKKQEHELWVQRTLSHTTDSRKVAEQAIVASLIDNAVSLCEMGEWNAWTSWALAPAPRWQKRLPDQITEFRRKVVAAIWPDGFDELKRATTAFSILLHQAAEVFLSHSKRQDDYLHPDKFYQTGARFNPHYHKDLARYNEWINECHKKVKEATKAANWFADVVRRDVNPMFFAIEGRFLITEGPFTDMSYGTTLVQFTEEEKSNLPSVLNGMEKAPKKQENASRKKKGAVSRQVRSTGT